METESIIVFEGEGEPLHARFTESELTFSYRLLAPNKHIYRWRGIAFLDLKWHYPKYRNWGIPNG